MKLPVFKTVGASFSYIIAHFLTIVKIAWLPVLAMLAVQLLVMPDLFDAQQKMMDIDPNADPAAAFEHMRPMAAAAGKIYLAMAIFYPMVFTGLLRHVILGESPRLPFYFAFGAGELRIIGSTLLLLGLFTLVYFVGVVALAAIIAVLGMLAGVLGAAGASVAGVVGAALMFAWIVAMIWFCLRMSLVYPACIGERKIGVAASWALTKGSTISLALYWGVWWGLMILMSIIWLALMGIGYADLLVELFNNASDPQAAAEIQRKLFDLQRSLWSLSDLRSISFVIVGYALTIVWTALMVAPAGVAYRFLKGTQGAGSN
ncbi:MAG: hypothetical protein R3C42_01275 [Parvularculaceae bacterium]|nr:hypothetical protein [Parvularculaceae bacterium]